MEILMSAILIPCMIWDIKEKKIPLWFILLGFVGSMGICFLFPRKEIANFLFSFIPGGIFLLYGKITEAIGYGDGLLILMGGFWLTAQQIWLWLIVAFFLSAGYSVFLLWGRKMDKHTQIPFVPFLTASLLICNVFIF